MIKQKHIPQWKLDEVEHLVELFKKNKVVVVIEVAHINDKQIQDVRKNLRGKAVVRMSKKSLQIRAIEKFKKESKKPNLDELTKNIAAQTSFAFTNMEPFELKKIFEENKWMVAAKPDEVTPVDIWVPEGDTGLPTGQVISELNMTLRLPTRIQNDTIWIREDTMSHSAGDFVSIKQAAVLKKLGVAPIESIIKIHFAWNDGEIIPADVLYMDTEAFQQDVMSCYYTAQKVALELGIIDTETIEPLVQKAYRESLNLLIELGIFDETMVDEYVRRAELNAKAINSSIFGVAIEAPVKEEKTSPKKDEPEDEPEEEEVGIGGLFG
jgi:large subunit ribosomal protein L10